jgi:hypothetical protein
MYFENADLPLKNNCLKGQGQGKLTFVCESCYVEVVYLHHPAVAGHPGLHCHPSHLLPRHQATHTHHPTHVITDYFSSFIQLRMPKFAVSKIIQRVFINCSRLYRINLLLNQW